MTMEQLPRRIRLAPQSSWLSTLSGPIKDIDGENVSLEDEATFTVSKAPVQLGVLHVAIRHLRFDGNKGANSRFNPYCIRLTQARFFTVEQCVIKNADHGGITVTCCMDGLIRDNYLSYNGQPESLLGSNVWVFRNCRNINVGRNVVGGGSTCGIAIDDRSTGD